MEDGPVNTSRDAPIRMRVQGMDCAKDVAKIERAARLAGIAPDDVKVSDATHIMTLRIAEADLPVRTETLTRAEPGGPQQRKVQFFDGVGEVIQKRGFRRSRHHVRPHGPHPRVDCRTPRWDCRN